MGTQSNFPFFETINDWHVALNTGLCSSHDDFHIFRYEEVMDNLVLETPYYKDAFFHITFATSMDAVLTINDKAFDCKKGGLLFFIAPEQLIHWKRGNIHWEGFVMLIKPKFISYSIQGSQLLKDLMVFEKEGIHVTQTTISDEKEFVKVFEAILQEYHSEKLMKFEMIRAQLKILLIMAQRINLKATEHAIVKKQDLVAYNFQNLVNKYFSQKRAVYEYAKELNITKDYLNEIVKKQTGKSASTIIRERIILEAKCLLLYTPLDIAEIAFELNFNEPSNFMRFFKTNEKITPSEYRKTAATLK
ncbi:helix-turn-helix domain-containing protein [Flavobacterium sp.]|uniref:AraC family transcriptional regulator n=1 Tax=Flavobacterium sp. TaxID=239 RepID=UPI00286A76B9|nr:helix-turn-helix domain-containing protein [Flavobacterium sp.]